MVTSNSEVLSCPSKPEVDVGSDLEHMASLVNKEMTVGRSPRVNSKDAIAKDLLDVLSAGWQHFGTRFEHINNTLTLFSTTAFFYRKCYLVLFLLAVSAAWLPVLLSGRFELI